MKVDIITFHFTSNCGGVLQCWALQKYLDNNGHEAHIINYRPRYHTIRYDELKNPFVYVKYYRKQYTHFSFPKRVMLACRSFARCVYLDCNRAERNTARLFRSFIESNLHLTKEYSTLIELQKNPPAADAYITGSDQLWNPDLLDGAFDSAYFLDFGNDTVQRISYAVSTGRTLTEKECMGLKDLCGRLNAVSIREYNDTLIKSLDRNVQICIDPTLLLNAEDYRVLESDHTESEPYIFVYGFEDSEQLHEAVQKAASKFRVRIINGSPHRIKLKGNVVNFRECGPAEFLTLIKNAQFVVTNSFHGTVFSIIYKKNFITVPHKTRGSRMAELLEKLGLNNRLWGSTVFSDESSIDYEGVYRKLDCLRDHSEKYLFTALNNEIMEPAQQLPETLCEEAAPEPVRAFYGWHWDVKKLKESSSGGAATALAENMLAQGGLVFGVAYTGDFQSAHYICVDSPEALAAIKGSKYVYPTMKTERGTLVFNDVEQALLSGKKVLFIGLGCLVGGLRTRLEKHGIPLDNLYTVDLICHGPTLPEIQKRFVEALENKYQAHVTYFNTRYNVNGWDMPYLHVQFANNMVYLKPLYETDLGFAMKYYCRDACFSCHFKGDNHAADITVGDFWGLTPKMKEYNKDGVSLLLSRSGKGDRMISELENSGFYLGRADLDFALERNQMYAHSVKKAAFYEQFETDLQLYSLHDAVRRNEGYRIFVKAAVKKRLTHLSSLKQL